MTKFSTISLYLTKLYVTWSFTTASSVTNSECHQNLSNSVAVNCYKFLTNCIIIFLLFMHLPIQKSCIGGIFMSGLEFVLAAANTASWPALGWGRLSIMTYPCWGKLYVMTCQGWGKLYVMTCPLAEENILSWTASAEENILSWPA